MGVFLGIDTSAYTTSVAVCSSEGTLYANDRALLRVPGGERGLRQSDACFQHVQQLPDLLSENLSLYRDQIEGVCVSTRPRPLADSYMPVFAVGQAFAKALSDALHVPLFETSHQEGHILAASYEREIDFTRPLLCAHLSGGTLELVLLQEGRLRVVGGSRDLSYGQLIDRTGVMLGLPFPAGNSLDKLAVEMRQQGLKNPIGNVFCEGSWLSLSGLEDRLKQAKDRYTKEEIAFFAMERIAESFCQIAEAARRAYRTETLLVCGGVACSRFLRDYCQDRGYRFGRSDLCADNAAGVALARGKNPWR